MKLVITKFDVLLITWNKMISFCKTYHITANKDWFKSAVVFGKKKSIRLGISDTYQFGANKKKKNLKYVNYQKKKSFVRITIH